MTTKEMMMGSSKNSLAAIVSSFTYQLHPDLKSAIWWSLLRQLWLSSQSFPRGYMAHLWLDSAMVTFIHFLDLCLKGLDSIF